MNDRDRRRLTVGLILVAIGGWFFLAEQGYLVGLGYEVVMALAGAALLVGYFLRRRYGLLVPGCILLGLALGVIFERQLGPYAEGPLLGLALGFFAIYLLPLGLSRRSPWWPLVPAVLLLVLAVPSLRDLFDLVADSWQLLLVVIGLVLVILALVGSSRRPRTD